MTHGMGSTAGDPPHSGYTCPACGTWVQYGYVHYCFGTQPLTKDDRIITLLDQIDRKLNLILEKMK